MRRDFVRQILVEMEANPNIIFLTADLGFNALEEIKKRFPARFINAGIAEQHMVGMAAGLALTGKKVITYSIASFATMRPYEQIRTDVCYHNLDVKIIGTGGGVNYPTHGVTHHTFEDVAIMNVLPNMKVLSPATSWEAEEGTKALVRDNGPVYMRLGKSPGINFHKPNTKFIFGRGYVIREGSDILLVSTGNIADIVITAAELIEQQLKKTVGVLSMPSIKPFDESLLLAYTERAEGIFTIEEHSVIGGLGSIVAATLWKHGVPKRKFHTFGFPDVFQKEVGDREYLLALIGIESKSLAREITKRMKEKD